MKYYDYEYRVRYADTDKMGISYYANYFVWFESARTEYFRALGMPYTECEKEGIYLPVIETKARYRSPSTYDDLVVVRTSVSDMGSSTMRFEYDAFLKESGKRLVTGYSVHVFVGRNMRPVRTPESVKNKVTVHSLLENKPGKTPQKKTS